MSARANVKKVLEADDDLLDARNTMSKLDMSRTTLWRECKSGNILLGSELATAVIAVNREW